MKRDVDTLLLDLTGQAFVDVPTLKDACFLALQAQVQGDERAPVAEKIKTFAIAGKIVKGGVVDFTTEELAFLKERIGKVMHPFVVGRAYELLEQEYVATEL